MNQLTVFVRCLRNVQAGKQLHAPGAELNLTEGDAAELVKLGAVELIEQPREEAELLGIELAPAMLILGERQLTAEDVLKQAFDESGLTIEQWNALKMEDQAAHIDTIIAQAVSPQRSDQGETNANQSGVDAEQSSETVAAEPSKSPAAESDLPAAGTGGDAAVAVQASARAKRKK